MKAGKLFICEIIDSLGAQVSAHAFQYDIVSIPLKKKKKSSCSLNYTFQWHLFDAWFLMSNYYVMFDSENWQRIVLLVAPLLNPYMLFIFIFGYYGIL